MLEGWLEGGKVGGGRVPCGSWRTEAAGVRVGGTVISWLLKCGEGP